jgi:hypothetical protein
MTNITETVKPTLEKWLGADEDTLLEQLGLRAQAGWGQRAEVAEFDPTIVYNVVEMGPMDELREIGRRLFRRWSRELHNLACGSDEAYKVDRESILQAIGGDDVAVAAAITAVLIVSFGVAPALAPLLAGLVLKYIIKPAGDTLCEYWREHLDVV